MRGTNYTLVELEQQLLLERRNNPDIAVYVRADRKEYFENVAALLDMFGRVDIRRLKFAARPERK